MDFFIQKLDIVAAAYVSPPGTFPELHGLYLIVLIK